MCFGGGGSQRPAVQKYKSKNDPVVITGEQEGLEDTKKKTKTKLRLELFLILSTSSVENGRFPPLEVENGT